MTREEAIKSLEAQRDCIILSCSGACHEGKECDECDFMYGKGTMGEMRDAYDMAIQALQEQKVGKWIEKDGWDGDVYYDCSVCGESWTTIEGTPWDNDMNYCPHCGAKMEGADNE